MSRLAERYVAGVDLGGTKIYTALAAPGGEILAEVKVPTEAAKGLRHVIDRIAGSVEQAQRDAGADPAAMAALGLGAPGPLDALKGIIYLAPNLGWKDVPIKQLLEKKLSVPVFLDNDANLAALGEHLYGAGRGEDNMVFITVSTGIGGALIIDGRLYRGSSDGAGEIGHITVEPNGPLCGCGNRGCLEALASGTAMAREAKKLVEQGRGRRILEAAGGDPVGITAAAVAAAAAAGDPGAAAIIDRAGGYLGIGVASVLNLLNPSLVVLGGGAMKIGEPLWQGLLREVRARALEAARTRARLVPADLGGRAGVRGAVALALSHAGFS